MTALYEKTRQNGNKLIVLSGGAYGYGIFRLNPKLVPEIVDWMKKQLNQSTADTAAALGIN